MAIKQIVKAKQYKVKEGDSIKSIAEKHGITWQQLSKFNWGTDRPNEINIYLRNQVGCRKKTADGNNYVFTNEDTPGIIYIPETFPEKNYSVSSKHRITVKLPSFEQKTIELTSKYAHNQLERVAKELSEPGFIAMLLPIFGGDISSTAYRDLYRNLSDKVLPAPKIQVDNSRYKWVGDYKIGQNIPDAAYNSSTQTIHIHSDLVLEAISDEINQFLGEGCKKLFTALIEEYGHYIDDILRNRLSAPVGGDAKFDEGAIFAYNFGVTDILKDPVLHYADVSEATYSGPLKLNLTNAKEAIEQYASKDEQLNDGKYSNWEYFGAGMGDAKKSHSYAHRKIELALKDIGFTKNQLVFIYFGNWLRDFSQVIDPKAIRPEKATMAQAQALYDKIFNNDNKKQIERKSAYDSFRFSRSALTKIVGCLAYKEFEEDGEHFAEKFMGWLHGPDHEKILGCYRAEEHMDNPFGMEENLQLIDPDFEDIIKIDLKINEKTGLRCYLDNSINYLEKKFNDAIIKGKTPEGLRSFGEGLHVLEDFFSHSNFIEVCLIKLGYTDVKPWVDIDVKEYIKAKKLIPITTGCFGGSDMAYSIGPKIAAAIPTEIKEYEYSPEKCRKITAQDKIISIILEDYSKAQASDKMEENVNWVGLTSSSLAKIHKFGLSTRDAVCVVKDNSAVQFVSKNMYYLNQSLLIKIKAAIHHRSMEMAQTIDDEQTKAVNGKVGINPTHSQLAKDHDFRHLHELAAILAKEAVRRVGIEMKKAMETGFVSEGSNPVKVAKDLIKHPNLQTWADSIVLNYARTHPAEIEDAKKLLGHDHNEERPHPKHTYNMNDLHRIYKELAIV